MGFKRVYKSLQEVFPQIDARVLRAVAIEHSKDADAAVEAVLMEIIPFFSERSTPNTPLSRNTFVGESSGEVSTGSASNSQSPDHASANGMGSLEVQPGNNTSVGGQQFLHDASASNSQPPDRASANGMGSMEVQPGNNTSAGGWQSLHDASASKSQSPDCASANGIGSMEFQPGNNNPVGGRQLLHDADNGNYKPYDTYDDLPNGKNVIDGGINTHQMECLEGLQTNETFFLGKFSDGAIKLVTGTTQDLNLFDETELGTISNKENEFEKSYADTVVGTASFTVDDQKVNSFNSSVQIPTSDLEDLDGSLSKCVDSQMEMESLTGHSKDLANSVQLHTGDLEELDASLSNNVGSQMEMESSTGRSEDLYLNDSLSHASQMNIIEVLEQVIGDARNNKTTLFSSMESVINLMRDVELKEQAAEQAKVEAAMGGNDILVKVEELKQMIHHATEANSMHAGEVYGEKSILASELRELQSRVLSLSDERDKSLDVLDEMRNALEVRLAEAENEIKSADQQRVEKEQAALEALAAEELVMEKVVQESKILRQQAEENTKLQEFLVDRGRLVDMLQGEIAVICQDVRLLKQKFDDNIPFSKSLSSCHTSCILASSSVSSLNGSSPNEVEPVPNPAPDSPKTTVDVSFDEPSSIEKIAEDNLKELLEDGWELFDGNETLG